MTAGTSAPGDARLRLGRTGAAVTSAGFPCPAGVLGIPIGIALLDGLECPRRFVSRGVGTEPVLSRAYVVAALHPVVAEAPEVACSAQPTVVHSITVPLKPAKRYRFGQNVPDFHCRNTKKLTPSPILYVPPLPPPAQSVPGRPRNVRPRSRRARTAATREPAPTGTAGRTGNRKPTSPKAGKPATRSRGTRQAREQGNRQAREQGSRQARGRETDESASKRMPAPPERRTGSPGFDGEKRYARETRFGLLPGPPRAAATGRPRFRGRCGRTPGDSDAAPIEP